MVFFFFFSFFYEGGSGFYPIFLCNVESVNYLFRSFPVFILTSSASFLHLRMSGSLRLLLLLWADDSPRVSPTASFRLRVCLRGAGPTEMAFTRWFPVFFIWANIWVSRSLRVMAFLWVSWRTSLINSLSSSRISWKTTKERFPVILCRSWTTRVSIRFSLHNLLTKSDPCCSHQNTDNHNLLDKILSIQSV